MFQNLALTGISKVTALLRKTPIRDSKLLGDIQDILMQIVFHQTTAQVGEFTMKVHSSTEYVSKKLILFGGYEQEEIDFLCSLAKPGDTFVDVGANIGLYTLHLSRAVGSTGRVLAFEPDPDNLALLRENIRLNNCDNVTVFPFALGNTSSHQKLYTCKDNKGYQGWADFNSSGTAVEVEVKAGADVLGDLTPELMKIDVEGAEPLVWKGLKQKPKKLLFEFIPYIIRGIGEDPLQFLQNILDAGYSLFYIENKKLTQVKPEEITLLVEQGRDYNLFAQQV
jgi:FkbM family methyltransferase